MDKVREALDENVRAALYRAAMEGKVTAQSCWMRYMHESKSSKDKREAAAQLPDEALRERARREARLLKFRDTDSLQGDE